MGVSEDMQQRQKLQSLDITDELLDGIFPTDILRSKKSTTEKKEHLTINIYKTEDGKQKCSNCIEWNSKLVSIALLYTNYHISFLCILILSCLCLITSQLLVCMLITVFLVFFLIFIDITYKFGLSTTPQCCCPHKTL